jgi:DnaJ-domain-containing protein 1
MAAEQLKRAMENSLIDFAILFQRAAAPTQSAVPQQSAAELLGVSEDADQAAIKQAYRRKALVAHPDKGGSVTAFLELQRAYRQLTQQAADSPRSVSGQIEADAQRALDIPERMRTHRNVVESW